MITYASVFSLALCAAFSLPIDNAKAADLPSGYTCDDLRTKVAEYGPSLILASARSRGVIVAVAKGPAPCGDCRLPH
jgi:hypothetical protein